MNKLLYQICPKIVKYIQNVKNGEKTVARYAVLLYHCEEEKEGGGVRSEA